MAKVKMTLTRPSANVEWYEPSVEETEFVKSKYKDLWLTVSTRSLPEGHMSLVQVRTRSGNLSLCQEFLSDLTSPTSILYGRYAYYDANGITWDYQLIE